ncbi:TolC family protein [bacterium]|nr:TolC family protein [bacterium]
MNRLYAVLICCLISIHSFAEDRENTWNSPGIPPKPGEFWKVPAGDPPKLRDASPLQASPEIQNKSDWRLAELIDFALSTAYRTRISWNEAKAAQAEYRSLKGEYFPDVTLGAELGRIRASAIGGQFTFKQDTVEPAATVRWVLFDFGRKGADVDEARKLLLAANFTHNAEVQNLILDVQRAYYGYIGSKALLQAQESSVDRAKADLDAARQRHDAGLATIADVLQAQTQLAEADFAAATTRGQIQILRGTLAIAIGIPPLNPQLEVVDELPQDLPLDEVSKEVVAMIQEGIKRRPELAALRAEALGAEAHARSVRAEQFPVIETNASVQRLYYLEPSGSSNNYSAALTISFPLFDGFSRRNDYLQAKAEADAAKARVASFQQEVGLQVWTSFFQLNTSAERIKATRKLLESAQESYEVASGRYKEGVGSILDVLAAQNALENARSQDVRTRTEWLLALSQLYHDMGVLGQENEFSIPSNAAKGNQEVKQ